VSSFIRIPTYLTFLLPFTKYTFLLPPKLHTWYLCIRSQPIIWLLLLTHYQAFIRQLYPLSLEICFSLIHCARLISVIGVSWRFRGQLLLFLYSFQLGVAVVVVVNERAHVVVTWILSKNNSSVVVLWFHSVIVSERMIISWELFILTAALTVIRLVSTSDTNVTVRWFTETLSINGFIISWGLTSPYINLVSSLYAPRTPYCRSIVAV
jgi:hypothetical protein